MNKDFYSMADGELFRFHSDPKVFFLYLEICNGGFKGNFEMEMSPFERTAIRFQALDNELSSVAGFVVHDIRFTRLIPFAPV